MTNTSTAFADVFPRQLCHWTLHCSVNALPSFCIALFTLSLWKCPLAVTGMLCGIVTFILLYAFLTSLEGPLARKNHLFSQALHIGTQIRAGITAVSMILLLDERSMMIMPDLWCGFLAVELLNPLFSAAGFSPDKMGFIQVYLTTLTAGLILSFLLLMISFFVAIVLQWQKRPDYARGMDLSRF